MIQAHQELDRFMDKSADSFFRALMDLVWAHYYGTILRAREKFADAIGETLELANLNGRKRLIMEADSVAKFAESPLAPDLTFLEAKADLVAREPVLAKSAAEVAKLYSTEKVFAMAKAADKVIVERVQKILGGAISSSISLPEIEAAIEEVAPFGRAYADTVFRTNVSTAYTEGRFQQAKDPGIAEVIPAFIYWGVHDNRTRQGRPEDHGANHLAAFGLIAATDDPIWKKCKPPCGYNCRCSVNFISLYDLERKGLIKNGKVVRYEPPGFENFASDPGFKVGAF